MAQSEVTDGAAPSLDAAAAKTTTADGGGLPAKTSAFKKRKVSIKTGKDDKVRESAIWKSVELVAG